MRTRAGERLSELALGIAANLCCHAELAAPLAASAIFVEAVCSTLQSSTYGPALAEACRALEAALDNGRADVWAADLLRPAALQRLVWAADNTRLCSLRVRSAPRRPSSRVRRQPKRCALRLQGTATPAAGAVRELCVTPLPPRRSLGVLTRLAGLSAPDANGRGGPGALGGAAAALVQAGAAALAAGLLQAGQVQRLRGAAPGSWEEDGDADAGEAPLETMMAALALLQAPACPHPGRAVS